MLVSLILNTNSNALPELEIRWGIEGYSKIIFLISQ